MRNTFTLDNNRLFLFAIALTIAPLWMVTYLPMVDLPQHAAQVTSMQELLAGNPVFEREFEFNWFTPYVVTYLLLFVVGTVFPMTIATKIVTTVAVAGIPLMIWAIMRATGADERLRWLAIPGGISFAFYWGFLSFMVAALLGLLFVLQTVRYERDPSLLRAAGLAAMSVLLFFTHVMMLGFASLICLAYLFGGHFRKPKTFMLLAIPYTAAIPLIVLWGMTTYSAEGYVQDAPVIFGTYAQRLIYALSQPSGIDFFRPVPSVIIALILYLSPILTGCTPTRDIRRWLMFGTVAVVFFTFPSYAFRTAFLFERFGIFLLPFWLLVWDRPVSKPKYVELLPILAITLIASFNIMRFSAFDRETRHFTAVAKSIEVGARVASVVGKTGTMHFQQPVYLHHAVWAQSLRKGIVDFNFSFFYPTIVRFRAGRQTGVNEQFQWFPFNHRWEEFDGDVYDYFLFHAEADLGEELFREHAVDVPLVAYSGRWWLYRNETPGRVR